MGLSFEERYCIVKKHETILGDLVNCGAFSAFLDIRLSDTDDRNGP